MNIIDKKLLYIIFLSSLLSAQVSRIELPMDISETTFNKSIPKPIDVFNHYLGEQHTRTDQIIEYFYAVANKSNRVVVENHGTTHEGRKLIHAIITSAENQNKLDEILKNNRNISLNPGKISKKTLWNIIKQSELSENDEIKLKKYCDKQKILFLSTPFSKKAVDRLEQLKVPAYKIGTGELTNLPFLI